jgi:Protein of unknown function (DUF2891)
VTIDAPLADRIAAIPLGHVSREYPHKLDHVLLGDADVRTPRDLHPIFFGSFDWHSCVHGWWTLLTLRRLFPDGVHAAAITDLADASFTAAKVAAEGAYLDRPQSGGFERPYGIAWLLALHLEASRHRDRDWAEALAPLARAFADRLRHYLDLLTYPIRTGTHFNTAFALILALDWAEAFDPAIAALIGTRARAWFAADRDAPAWEPGGDEFLSATLCEAQLMTRILAMAERRDWLAAFLPRLAEGAPETLFTPAIVSDRSDGKIAHLDGLNLSRAWCWHQLAPFLEDASSNLPLATADAHLAAAMPHLAADYAGEHWLATFALMALLAAPGNVEHPA